MTEHVQESYLYFDGDDVGAGIELCLLESDVAGAARLSRAVSSAIDALASALRMEHGAEILFAAGDEVLARSPHTLGEQHLRDLRQRFRRESGISISCGVASSPREATLNLHLAKLRGKNRTHGVGNG